VEDRSGYDGNSRRRRRAGWGTEAKLGFEVRQRTHGPGYLLLQFFLFSLCLFSLLFIFIFWSLPVPSGDGSTA
jgi:hypothetical protein